MILVFSLELIFIARLSTETKINSNEKTNIYFPINKIIFFDSNTKERIEI